MSKVTFIDLFAGIGGIRIAMEQNGFSCVMSSEIDKLCQDTYRANFGETPYGDIKEIRTEDIPDHDILCAGFPCQPFSSAGKLKGFNDTRGTLFFEIARILKDKKPKAILLENVKNLVYHDGGRTLSVILETLKDLGYSVCYKVLNAADFGVPQNRERIIIIGLKGTTVFDFASVQTTKRTCMADITDKNIPFEYLNTESYTLIPNPVRQPSSGLIFSGYLNKNLRKAGVKNGAEHLSRSHHQFNRIYSVYGTHPTISSQETSGRYYVLDESGGVRKTTLSECKKLMGFPEDYIFTGSQSTQYVQLGNSVCVPLITAVGNAVGKYI